MLELLDWGKKRDGDVASAPPGPGVALDASTALSDLAGRLETAGAAEPKARNEALARIQDEGEPHVAALLGRCLGGAGSSLAAREAAWKSLADYQTRLARALCTAAGADLTAQAAARSLVAVRSLVKIYLVHYESVPGRVWRVAYAIHAAAERARCATTPVHARADRRAVTTAEHELLRLLMLRVGAPDMIPPAQIEVADRVVEQLGPEFTLRQPGVADNPFCYEPDSDCPPRRAKDRPPSATARYFGPGMGYDSLERIARQLGATQRGEFHAFGKDIPARAQLGGVHHLLAFWRADSPYARPAHEPATGTLEVVHDYDPVCQYLSLAGGGGLSLTEYAPTVPPETWTLGGSGGGELGAEVPRASRVWTRCGCVVGYTRDGGAERAIGLIRRMHAHPDGSLHVDIAVLSASPRATALREVLEKGEDSVFTNASSRQFAARTVNAVILADGSDGRQPANLLLPADHWKEGRVYETASDTPPRYLRVLKAVRHGEDFVRATFEWVKPQDPSIPVTVPPPGLSLDPG
jgi:hypothetical protein